MLSWSAGDANCSWPLESRPVSSMEPLKWRSGDETVPKVAPPESGVAESADGGDSSAAGLHLARCTRFFACRLRSLNMSREETEEGNGG